MRASAQNARIMFYDSCASQINRCVNEKNYGAAVSFDKKLNQKHQLLTTSLFEFWGLSLLAEDSAGFYQASRLWILNSALPIKTIIENYGKLSTRVYALNYTPEIIAQSKIFGPVYERLQQEESPLIVRAKNTLDWQWIIFLEGILTSNIDYRYLPDSAFAGSEGKMKGIIFIDSLHLMRVNSFIASNGFPTMSRLGMNWGEIQPILKHCIELVGLEEEKRSDYFLVIWKSLFPKMYQAVLDWEMEPDFYRFLYRSLERSLTKVGHSEKMDFFKQYELHKTTAQ
ncbi:hypothetical protein DN068_05680 [Taibaiella soli]|uniref:Uncharacterized protein n=2 Tax=Taibaiella soli TaxID=1649169 RepID=A0A2W2C1C0_9BACT|nr:hypothetical protein DN068_05680 [Taibaiella soli]